MIAAASAANARVGGSPFVPPKGAPCWRHGAGIAVRVNVMTHIMFARRSALAHPLKPKRGRGPLCAQNGEGRRTDGPLRNLAKSYFCP